ncbi:MAG: phospho-N-acetylmuramoyl-pentapeptide-transferase, partial [Steroidobacteraceae bacterium]
MLYWLAKQLALHHSLFNAFSYLTLRAILAAMSALSIALLVGPAMIARLSRYQIGQVVRDDGPKTHFSKAGTPTMGGALIIVAIVVATLLWADLRNRFVWVTLGVTLGFGLIGFYDDYLKLVVRNPRGLIARWKYFWQSVIGLGAALLLYRMAHDAVATTFF